MQTFQKRDYEKPQAWALPASSTYFRGLSLPQHLAHLGPVPAFCEEAALHWSHGLCLILHVGAREEELFGYMYRFQRYWVGLQIPSCIAKLALNWQAKQLSTPERYTYLTRSGLHALPCCPHSHWAWQDPVFGLPDPGIKPAFKQFPQRKENLCPPFLKHHQLFWSYQHLQTVHIHWRHPGHSSGYITMLKECTNCPFY